MNEVRKLLRERHPDRAMTRFVNLVKAEPDQVGALAREMTHLLLEEYDRFLIAQVHRIYALIPEQLPAPVAGAMKKLLDPPVERTRFWIRELESVTRERLAREARKCVTLNDPKRAAACGCALIRRGRNEGDRRSLGEYLIQALAGLPRDADRSRKALAKIAEDPVAAETGLDFRAAFEKAVKAGGKTLEASDREWTQVQTAAVASLRGVLPDDRQGGEPDAQDIQKLQSELMALLRAGLAEADDAPWSEGFIDALGIIMEFCPVEAANQPSIAGVEPRLFLSLTMKGKLTAVRALSHLGRNEELRRRILALCASPEFDRRLVMLSAVIGGLRHPDFMPVLKEAVKKAESAYQHNLVFDAIGRNDSPEAAGLLLVELRKCMKKIADSANVRRAETHLVSLGRIVRGKETPASERNRIIEKAIEILEDKDYHVNWMAARELFTVKLDEIELKHRTWAARQALRALFSKGAGADKVAARQSHLGFRQPMATTLLRLGKPLLDEMIEFARHHTTQYSGAFRAFAEIMEKIGDERAAPVLEAMARTTFMHAEDTQSPDFLRDLALDPESGDVQPIDRDKVLHALLYALDKVGGEEGRRIVLGFADQVGGRQLAAPGNETASFLAQAKREAGTLGRRESPAQESQTQPESEIEPEEIEKAASQARGGLFGNKRKQVEALALLGRARDPETLPAVVACLKHKDPMVANAAETSLIQFVTPPPGKRQFERIVMAMLQDKKALKGEALDRLLDAVARHFPKGEEYQKLFKRCVSVEIEDGEMQHRLIGAMRAPSPEPAVSPSGGDTDATGEKSGEDLSNAERKWQELKAKQEYLKKRKEWIAAGKHGPPPQPPPGLETS